MTMIRSLLVLVLLLTWVPPAQALIFKLRDDRLTLKAQDEKLVDILQRFAHAGVEVKVDPALQATVSGRLVHVPVEKAFEELLQPFGYVLFWDVVPGPLGTIERLSEIQVFRRGHQKEVRPLATSPNLVVSTGPMSGQPFVADEILIGFTGEAHRDDVRRLLAQIGGSIVDSIPHLGIYKVRLPPGTNIPALVEQLQKNPAVAKAEPNYVYDVPNPVQVGDVASAEKEDDVKVPNVTGAPPIAILDSGLMAFEGLSDHIVGELDAVSPDRALADPLGHGTQMALIAAGLISPSGAEGDVASGSVPLVAIRAFDDNGRTSSFGIMRSLDYALEKGARVVNMSWGSETKSAFLATSVGYAQQKGMVLVSSAGNEPTGKPLYPASYQGVLSVSATGASGELWNKSNYGDEVFLAAPGTAKLPVGHDGPPGAYAGTSISSAYVSRALAQYFALHPEATRTQAINALRASLTDAGTPGKDPYYGYGVLDAAAKSKLLALP